MNLRDAAAMKKHAFLLLSAVCALHAEPLAIQITKVTGEPMPGYLIGAEKDGLIISDAPNGGNSLKVPLTTIRDMVVDEPKGWSIAQQTYASGNFAEAEKLFAKLGDEFEKLVPMQDGYGSQARLFQFMCLQRLGRYADLGKLMDRQLANPLSFGPQFTEDFVDLEGWALLGKKDWLSLGTFIKKFEDANPLNLPQAPFKRLRSSRLAALCYLRAVWNEESQKKPDLALMDYHRALTLDLGSDRSLFRLSAMAALRLTDTKVAAAPTDEKLKNQAKSLALVCRDLGGPGALAKEFEKYLK